MRATRFETTRKDTQLELRALSPESEQFLEIETSDSAMLALESDQDVEEDRAIAERPWIARRFPFHSIRLAMGLTLIVTVMY